MHYATHKRQYVEKIEKHKWDPNQFHGKEFSEYQADPFKFHKKSL